MKTARKYQLLCVATAAMLTMVAAIVLPAAIPALGITLGALSTALSWVALGVQRGRSEQREADDDGAPR